MVKETQTPIEVKHDRRLGRLARTKGGFVGVVDKIWRFSDGVEMVHLFNEQMEIGNGGLYWEEITFINEKEK